MKRQVPLERTEQKYFVHWLESRCYRFTHVPSGIPIPASATKWALIASLKANGWRPGCPDLLIILKSGGVAFIEIKRVGERVMHGSEQALWLQSLLIAGVKCGEAAGCQAAIALVERWEQCL